MKTSLIILALLLSVILQTSFVPFLSVWGVSPNLILVVVLILVILRSFKETWWQLVLTGLLLDFFSGLPFGLISLSLILTAYLVDWIKKSFSSAMKFWIIASLVISGSLLYNLILVASAWLFRVNLINCLKFLPLEIAYNLVIIPIIFYGTKKIFSKK